MRHVFLEELELTARQVRIIAIWIDILRMDGRPASERAATIFESYPGVAQFHDPDRLAGAAVASAIGAPGRVAWDMYLFFDASASFGEELPRPHDWAHQLSQDEWADPSRFHWAEDLQTALCSKMAALLDVSPSS